MPIILDTVSDKPALKHGKSYLDGFKPCQFPALLRRVSDTQESIHEAIVELAVKKPEVDEFCSRHKIATSSLSQTAWAIVTSCYAGVEDVLFGYYTTDGRSPRLGNPADTTICRMQITPKSLLCQTMIDLTRDSDFASSNRHCEASDIQQHLHLEGHHYQLYNSGIQIERASGMKNQLALLREDQPTDLGEVIPQRDASSQVFIMVEALIDGQLDILARVLLGDDDSLAVSIQTRSTRFSYSQTVDVANTLEKAFVEIFKSHSQTTIEHLNIFSQRDFNTVMSWNRSAPQSAEICFHEYFDHVAQKSPHAPAICSWDGDLTYSELSLLSNRLARYLLELGVTPGMAVPICFDKSLMAIIAMLSIFKAGGAFVAIDPRWPSSRIQTILKAANASIVVADPSHCHIFKSFTSDVVPLASSLIHNFQPTKPFTSIESSPSMTAYIVFTSGSTGTPKGIMIDHRALCTAVLSLAAPMGISATSRVLQFAAYTFDASYGDIFITLSQGGCICIPSEHERVNDLAGVIVRLNATAACLTPSVVRVLRPEQVPCLKSLSLGGEALLPENVELWAPNVSLTNVYGPSEATIWCSSQTKLKINSQANNIGHGLEALMWIASITNHNILSPIGCIGELLIEGPVLAQGYLDAEQTKRAFIENPRWAEAKPGGTRRFYKTGDLVKYDADGTINFIGRKDTQIKVHGHRIEMGEIEYHLSKHDLLRQSLIAYPSTGVYKHKLVAVVVLKTSPRSTENEGIKLLPDAKKHAASLEVSKIKQFLASKVPYYMIPPSWIVVEDIPLITSGKINRVLVKAFLENVAEGHISQNIKTATFNHTQNTPAEMRLQNIWSQVLDRKTMDVGIDQTFDALGGDSLAAMDLVARCKAEGLSIEMKDLLAGTTIRQLAIRLQVVLSEAEIKELKKTNMKTGSRASGGTHLQMQRKLLPAWWDI